MPSFKAALRGGLILAALAAVAAGASYVLVTTAEEGSRPRPATASSTRAAAPARPKAPSAKPWNLRPDGTPQLYGEGWFDDSGYFFGVKFTDEDSDQASLPAIRANVGGRARRGVDYLRNVLAHVPPDSPDAPLQVTQLHLAIGGLFMYEGKFDEAVKEFEAARDSEPDRGELTQANYEALLGVASLRRGEVDNCVACCREESCIFPLAASVVHTRPAGSRGAMRHFAAYLKARPEDLGVRWLYSVAAMTLGEYPDAVPPDLRVPIEPAGPVGTIGRFPNVAPAAGLDPRENMAGGTITDDFDGDGRIDVFTSTSDPEEGCHLYLNKGDGHFEERTDANLEDQVAALNCNQADFDNDGDLDVILMRGGWEKPFRLSLLRNDGKGRFDDVTMAAGLGTPIACQSVAWGDYDNDGKLDLYACGEYVSGAGGASAGSYSYQGNSDARNYCRLYRNNGDGTFADVAEVAGVTNQRRAKGAAWGDYDGDGKIDLYVSNSGSENRLYRNNGDGTFTDVARTLGVAEPIRSFSCWFWDYDNDGRLDIYCTGFGSSLSDIVRSRLNEAGGGERPRLYRNEGPAGFRDVTKDAGLDRVWVVMGSNFGDIDNDGYLDAYLGTGQPACFYVVPNVLLRNVGGARFEDVTPSSGTGHLQKGHGVSMADWDDDGDLDIFLGAGGATPGDKAHNQLFLNPGNANRSLTVKLVGTRSNRAAIGAEVRAVVRGPDGKPSTRLRLVGNGSSFGGNGLAAVIGLGAARSADSLEVRWPGTGGVQTFRDVKGDQSIEITEGKAEYRVIPRKPIPPPAAR
ncbi:FG-GAP repeat protein [Aquisphaera giovannonii]|uniref:FG-GAP repeat protein n=1 Tax=Aquisphaera giovannonii TaxID=406548 RepID=A0A5B9W532_9BACT|nr:FG-GAP-like repeat-containing protein [Aquisphaera giovannonii]QEH35284.1 FG-GAP repeat protein [Aquisphaera giovannonii]